MSEPIDMSRHPWDAERFRKQGCMAQLVGGPCNGTMVRFYPGKRYVQIPIRQDPTIPKIVEKMFGPQIAQAEYRLELVGFGGHEHCVGVFEGSKPGSEWYTLLDDAIALRKIQDKFPMPAKHAKQTAQSISTSAELKEIDQKILKSMINMVDQQTEQSIGFLPTKKQDTAAPEQDTGDGTYSTSA